MLCTSRLTIRALLTLAVLLLGCRLARAECDQETHFTFNWPAPSTATVESMSDDGAEVIRSRYNLTLNKADSAGQFRISFDDFELLQVGDADLQDSAVLAEMAPLLALAAALPPIVVSTEGEFLRFEDWDRLVDALSDVISGWSSSVSDEYIDQFKSLLRDPATQQQMRTKLAEDWNLWVGAWVDLQLCRGESVRFSFPASTPWGNAVDAEAVITYLSADSTQPDKHRLVFEQQSGGVELRQLIMESVKQTIPPDQLDAEKLALMEEAIGNPFMTFRATLTTDPATLMPTRLDWTKNISMSNPADPEQIINQTETRVYEFTWH